MGYKEFEEIWANKVNGNISDFKTSINKLSKIELIDFIEYLRGYGGVKIHVIINVMRMYLEE